MIYEKVSFGELKAQIQSTFLVPIGLKWDLVPHSFHEIALAEGVELAWIKLEQWTAFEYGHLEVSPQEFLHILFKTIQPAPEERVAIVTDECFRERMGYKVQYKDLLEFIEEIYPEIYQMDFFQPFDVLFYCHESKLMTILHHDGYYVQYQNN
jgi:hypothetical protein